MSSIDKHGQSSSHRQQQQPENEEDEIEEIRTSSWLCENYDETNSFLSNDPLNFTMGDDEVDTSNMTIYSIDLDDLEEFRNDGSVSNDSTITEFFSARDSLTDYDADVSTSLEGADNAENGGPPPQKRLKRKRNQSTILGKKSQGVQTEIWHDFAEENHSNSAQGSLSTVQGSSSLAQTLIRSPLPIVVSNPHMWRDINPQQRKEFAETTSSFSTANTSSSWGSCLSTSKTHYMDEDVDEVESEECLDDVQTVDTTITLSEHDELETIDDKAAKNRTIDDNTSHKNRTILFQDEDMEESDIDEEIPLNLESRNTAARTPAPAATGLPWTSALDHNTSTSSNDENAPMYPSDLHAFVNMKSPEERSSPFTIFNDDQENNYRYGYYTSVEYALTLSPSQFQKMRSLKRELRKRYGKNLPAELSFQSSVGSANSTITSLDESQISKFIVGSRRREQNSSISSASTSVCSSNFSPRRHISSSMGAKSRKPLSAWNSSGLNSNGLQRFIPSNLKQKREQLSMPSTVGNGIDLSVPKQKNNNETCARRPSIVEGAGPIASNSKYVHDMVGSGGGTCGRLPLLNNTNQKRTFALENMNRK